MKVNLISGGLRVVGLCGLLCLAGFVSAKDGEDTISFVQRLTRDMYLQPLRIESCSLRIDVDRFDVGGEPHAFVVHVYETGEPKSPEILLVNIVRVHGHLQYVSASGAAVEGATRTKEAAARRREAAISALRALAGYVTDGKERRGTRDDFLELRFTHPDPPAGVATPTERRAPPLELARSTAPTESTVHHAFTVLRA